MQTKIILTILCSIILSSCRSFSPRYIPSSNDIDVNEYGSYIKISRKDSSSIDGELIAIDNYKIIVLSESENKCAIVPISKVQKFSLRYAKPKHYNLAIPAYALGAITHGFYLGISALINIIVTSMVSQSGETAFEYTDKNITYDYLKRFARFPQGIPASIDIATIKM